ncbi:MAG TPA: hypothetical protein VLE99_00205 [Candidatus Saccharimonadales bacterium]|nr:hypothetical protein [Candidatus Saccharimonadales bacterium]
MDVKANSLGIPFMKFQIDPVIVDKLVLKKYEEFDEAEPEELFLFEHDPSGDYYCVYAPADYNGNHHEDIARGFMASFVEAKSFEFIKPKHDDFYPTHYLARVVK